MDDESCCSTFSHSSWSSNPPGLPLALPRAVSSAASLKRSSATPSLNPWPASLNSWRRRIAAYSSFAAATLTCAGLMKGVQDVSFVVLGVHRQPGKPHVGALSWPICSTRASHSTGDANIDRSASPRRPLSAACVSRYSYRIRGDISKGESSI